MDTKERSRAPFSAFAKRREKRFATPDPKIKTKTPNDVPRRRNPSNVPKRQAASKRIA